MRRIVEFEFEFNQIGTRLAVGGNLHPVRATEDGGRTRHCDDCEKMNEDDRSDGRGVGAALILKR